MSAPGGRPSTCDAEGDSNVVIPFTSWMVMMSVEFWTRALKRASEFHGSNAVLWLVHPRRDRGPFAMRLAVMLQGALSMVSATGRNHARGDTPRCEPRAKALYSVVWPTHHGLRQAQSARRGFRFGDWPTLLTISEQLQGPRFSMFSKLRHESDSPCTKLHRALIAQRLNSSTRPASARPRRWC